MNAAGTRREQNPATFLPRNTHNCPRRKRCATISPMKRCFLILLLQVLPLAAQEGRQKFAKLGDFELVSGQILRECRIGYRTFGQLKRRQIQRNSHADMGNRDDRTTPMERRPGQACGQLEILCRAR